jgi:two-component system NarL family response regulator
MSPLISSGICAGLSTSSSFQTKLCNVDQIFNGALEDSAAFDVIVADIEFGLRLTERKCLPAIPMSLQKASLFVINHSNRESDIRNALKAGIHGYATLALTLDELHAGIRTVAQGMRYVCPKTAQRLAESMTREQLTPREADVLEQLARGSCNKSIAQELEMALGTVKAHVKALMSKLDAKTRTEVVTVAIAHGLVQPGLAFNRSDVVGGRTGGRSRYSLGEPSLLA